MAKKNQTAVDAHTANIRKVGKPRQAPTKKGNAPARTSRSGNGRRIKRQ